MPTTRRAQRTRRRSYAVNAAMLAAFALWSGVACDIPRDPEGTLTEATGGVLRVGATEAPPWVVKPSAPHDARPHVEGVEAVLVRRFARSIGAGIEWVWGSTADHTAPAGSAQSRRGRALAAPRPSS